MWIPCSLIFSSFVKRVYIFVLVYLTFQAPLAPISLLIPLLNNSLVFTCPTPTYCLHNNYEKFYFSFSSLITLFLFISTYVCALFSALAHTFSPQTYNITCSPFFPSLMFTFSPLNWSKLGNEWISQKSSWVQNSITVFLKAILAKYQFLGSAN